MDSNKTSTIEQRMQQLYWLKAIGIEYYCSENAISKAESSLQEPIVIANVVKQSHEIATKPSAPRDDVTRLPQEQKLASNNNPEQMARFLADSAYTLEELKQLVINFDGCNLKGFATNTVFADGNPNSKIMFIGEAPGATEDQQGIPFCGESGKLLDNILACIGISRKTNAYITNTVFWRPPANRAPTPEEINICKPFVEKHIALINPKLIILVGSTAATSLLGKHAGISKIRQEYYSYQNQYLQTPITTTAIFHPAYLLRQPLQKKTTWYDLLKIQQFITENIQ